MNVVCLKIVENAGVKGEMVKGGQPQTGFTDRKDYSLNNVPAGRRSRDVHIRC